MMPSPEITVVSSYKLSYQNEQSAICLSYLHKALPCSDSATVFIVVGFKCYRVLIHLYFMSGATLLASPEMPVASRSTLLMPQACSHLLPSHTLNVTPFIFRSSNPTLFASLLPSGDERSLSSRSLAKGANLYCPLPNVSCIALHEGSSLNSTALGSLS